MDERMKVTEALLFASGDPVPVDRLAAILGCSVKEAARTAEMLKLSYDREDRGIEILRLEKAYQMTTRKDCYPWIQALVRSSQKTMLSGAQMETLAIIAYQQPVTKTEIEDIRGVRSDAIVNKLIDDDLVRELGRRKAPGRPMLFGTTDTFLRTFGLSSLKELAHLPEQRAEEIEQLSLEQQAVIPEDQEGVS